MPPTRKRKDPILVKSKPHRYGHTDTCDYSVTSSFLNLPGVGALLVPWGVVKSDPHGVNKCFEKKEREIIYDNWINVFMAEDNLQKSIFGHLDSSSQTWIINITTSRDLENFIFRLKSFPSVVSAVMHTKSRRKKSMGIQVVIVLHPRARCLEHLVKNLRSVQQSKPLEDKFYFEVDLGPSIRRWAKLVLQEDLSVEGGRFAVMNGTPYNHAFDWKHILCCVPCLPCCLVASPIYRLHRRLKYRQEMGDAEEEIVFVGSESKHREDQSQAVSSLMSWVELSGKEGPFACERCGLLVNSNRCTCGGKVTAGSRVTTPKAPIDTQDSSSRRSSSPNDFKHFAARFNTLKDIMIFNQMTLDQEKRDVEYTVRNRKLIVTDGNWTSNDSVDDIYSLSSSNRLTTSGATPSDVNPSINSSSSSSRNSRINNKRRIAVSELSIFSSMKYQNKVHPVQNGTQSLRQPQRLWNSSSRIRKDFP